MLQVNILSKLTPDTDKLFAACAALVSGIAAATVFGQAPKSLFALNTSAAAKALSQATGALLRSKAAAEEAQVASMVNAHDTALLCADGAPHH